eukprot:COSAG01_NODE_699_length_14176_cov_21.100590_10_plen_228_part_00
MAPSDGAGWVESAADAARAEREARRRRPEPEPEPEPEGERRDGADDRSVGSTGGGEDSPGEGLLRSLASGSGSGSAPAVVRSAIAMVTAGDDIRLCQGLISAAAEGRRRDERAEPPPPPPPPPRRQPSPGVAAAAPRVCLLDVQRQPHAVWLSSSVRSSEPSVGADSQPPPPPLGAEAIEPNSAASSVRARKGCFGLDLESLPAQTLYLALAWPAFLDMHRPTLDMD